MWQRIYKNSPSDSKENKHLYGIWCKMKQRCLEPDSDRYKDYGGRGITVAQEWINNFDTFADWAKDNGYVDGLTIDRIDNDGNYCPGNCRWLTRREQNRNKRTNKMVTYMGETKPLIVWCEELGLKYDPIHNRIDKGWDVELAFKTPLASEYESFSSICRRHGIHPATARDRIKKFGWDFDKAVNTPCVGRGANSKTYNPEQFGTAECGVCGKVFKRNSHKQIYCGERCRSISKRLSYRKCGFVIDGRSTEYKERYAL